MAPVLFPLLRRMAAVPCRLPGMAGCARSASALPTFKGEENSTEYRIFFKEKSLTVSPWHDIPLFSGHETVSSSDDVVLNYVNEIPKGYDLNSLFFKVLLLYSFQC